MNVLQKILCLGLALTGTSDMARAQVKFKLSRQNATTYVVSMVPQKTVSTQLAITGTIQVSLKIRSADGFQLGEISSLQSGINWDRGSVAKSPDGARDTDYVSVALNSMGTRNLAYVEGKEVRLFSFTNIGNPDADAQLVDNTTEALITFKKNTVNIQNQISVLGFGRVNAYTGNLDDELPGSKAGLRRVFPNPASTEVTVEYANYQKALEGDVVLSIAETGSGRVLSMQTAYMRTGTNQATLNVGALSGGQYIIYLEHQGVRLGKGLAMIVLRQ